MSWARTEETRAIGRRVRAERIQAGLSRTELATLVNSSPEVITQYEMGYKMSDLRLSKIAQALGRSYDYMRTGEGSPYAQDVLRPGSLTPEISTPIATVIFAQLEPAIRRIVREELLLAAGQAAATPSRRRPRRTPRRAAAPKDAGASRGRGPGHTG